ncbi:hypothetical protein CR969_00385 [Candidatus Saccharibacteria bacterium]|nr:MAG: hypothetical protein CR969_00385 [Candidatus Saccharibacteria bacterium]
MKNMLNIQDQYKFPMGQLIYEQEPDAEVTFRMYNRNKDTRIASLVSAEELQDYYDDLRQLSFTPEEISILEKQTDKNYTKDFLGYLAVFRLPEISVSIDPNNNDLTAQTTASWNKSSLWEIPMLSALPELYYPRYIESQGSTVDEVWNEGDRRLDDMINLIQQHPDLRFAEFGTRRRFSSKWQDHAVERFVTECPDQLLGTSNPWLADKYSIPAVGTNAHELGMVYAALKEQRGENPLDGQNAVIADWLDRFPAMPVVLTDTFTTDATLRGMNQEQVEQVKSYRIDSGNEYDIGEKIIDFLKMHKIDPTTRSLFFSNSLTIQKAAQLHEHFHGRIGVAFGIGGGAVNNLGFNENSNLPSMNIVSKAIAVNGEGTVKLSDDPGKCMGKAVDIARYQELAETYQHEVADAA